jgi:hypothetical protein
MAKKIHVFHWLVHRGMPADDRMKFRDRDRRAHGVSYPDVVDLRARHEVFAEVMAYTLVPLSLTVGDRSERTWALAVFRSPVCFFPGSKTIAAG